MFTITCILLITGVILYRTFAIFEMNDNFNVMNGNVQDMGDMEFAFYIDGSLSKTVPEKKEDYSLDTLSSKCIDMITKEQISNVSWDDENWEVKIKGVNSTKTKCYLYFKQIYKEEILRGAIPDLGNGRLIPITISDNEQPSDVNYEGSTPGGKVKKADITTSWYSYEQKRWANAVILKDGEVDHYTPGEEIPESAIESYFVWIPRYKYQLKESESTYNRYTEISHEYGEQSNNDQITNNSSNSPYEIIFETKNDGTSIGSTQNSWLTHPAFTSFNSNGMWVGKFETGYNGAIDKLGAEKNIQEPEKIIIKPNAYSWRYINVSNAFYTSYGYLRELESHMMKNTEWGAIFYLTQSQYGRCKDICTEPRINNSRYITGYSANKNPSCGYTENSVDCNNYDETVGLNQDGSSGWSYYNSFSQEASTTGNYYGVFDMSGGSWEYVMGVLQSSENDASPASGRNELYNSGFKGKYSCPSCDSKSATEQTTGLEWPSRKYYDLYDYNTSNQLYQRGHLGDATKELGPFYSVKYNYNTKPLRFINSNFYDASYFVNSGSPWFMRGGHFTAGSDTGIGAFVNENGHASGNYSFRIVLMP